MMNSFLLDVISALATIVGALLLAPHIVPKRLLFLGVNAQRRLGSIALFIEWLANKGSAPLLGFAIFLSMGMVSLFASVPAILFIEAAERGLKTASLGLWDSAGIAVLFVMYPVLMFMSLLPARLWTEDCICGR
jgi:hypothetical protein